MDLTAPHRALLPSLHGDVVMALARLRRPVTGRELAAEAGGSQEGTRRVLAELEQQGIVTRQIAGRAHLFALNRDHLAFAAIEVLAAMRVELLERIRAEVAGWPAPRPDSVVLYGSAARREGTAESDIDLLVVRPASLLPDDDHWLARTAALADAVARWTGNQCELVEYTAAELRRPARRRSPFVRALVAEGVTAYGRPLARVLEEPAA